MIYSSAGIKMFRLVYIYIRARSAGGGIATNDWLHRRFARGSKALEVLAILAALEVLAAADEDIRPPAVATSATLPLDPFPDFRFPFPKLIVADTNAAIGYNTSVRR